MAQKRLHREQSIEVLGRQVVRRSPAGLGEPGLDFEAGSFA
jgi:hypothetical protein